jgi:hypothetical protein
MYPGYKIYIRFEGVGGAVALLRYETFGSIQFECKGFIPEKIIVVAHESL